MEGLYHYNPVGSRCMEVTFEEMTLDQIDTVLARMFQEHQFNPTVAFVAQKDHTLLRQHIKARLLVDFTTRAWITQDMKLGGIYINFATNKLIALFPLASIESGTMRFCMFEQVGGEQ